MMRREWRFAMVLAGLPLAALPLAGCGFHPMYEAPGQTHLPDVFVSTIPGRSGQLLREALQQRLSGSSEAQPEGYTLRVSYGIDSESIAIHGDNTSSRQREVGRANWVLSSVAASPVTLASGSARSVDGFNVVEAQYFASTLASESTAERLAGNLADNITTQVAVWFAQHPDGTAEGAAPATAPAPVEAPHGGFLGPQEVPGDTNLSPLQSIGPDGLPSGAIGRTTR